MDLHRCALCNPGRSPNVSGEAQWSASASKWRECRLLQHLYTKLKTVIGRYSPADDAWGVLASDTTFPATTCRGHSPSTSARWYMLIRLVRVFWSAWTKSALETPSSPVAAVFFLWQASAWSSSGVKSKGVTDRNGKTLRPNEMISFQWECGMESCLYHLARHWVWKASKMSLSLPLWSCCATAEPTCTWLTVSSQTLSSSA